jgi:hypothetical protein
VAYKFDTLEEVFAAIEADTRGKTASARSQALTLAREGKTFEEIGEAMGATGRQQDGQGRGQVGKVLMRAHSMLRSRG